MEQEDFNIREHQLTSRERDFENALRPLSFEDFSGQDKVVENLRIFVKAARLRGEALDHVLLHGPPGLGKTTLSNIIANELGVGFKVTSGPVLDKPGDLAGVLTSLEPNDVLFIDEIHTLIGSGSLDLANMFKEGLSRGTIKMIGATTTDEYERYILRDKAFLRRFEKVDVSEPTEEMTVEILLKTLPKLEQQTGVVLPYTDFINEKIMKFIVNMTTEYKRVYEISSRYPDIALVILRQCFSNAIYDNRKTIDFKNIYDAIRTTKAVYPDVIKKELVRFKEVFSEELKEENIEVH